MNQETNVCVAASPLPVRDVVRVVVVREDDKVCLCKKPSEDSDLVWPTLPGGGIEPGDTPEQTVIKECLEEVGMRVKYVRTLDYVVLSPPEVNRAERKGKFSGISTAYYLAIFKAMDDSLLGADGDAMAYDWLTIPEAIAALQAGPFSVFTEGRIHALRIVQDLIG